MIEKLSNIKPEISTGCYTLAAAYMGREVIQAAGCKVLSVFSSFIDKQKAEGWNQSSQNYLSSAKRNLVRNLGVTAGLITMGIVSDLVIPKIPEIKDEDKIPANNETGFWNKYGSYIIFGTGVTASATTGFVAGVLGAITTPKIQTDIVTAWISTNGYKYLFKDIGGIADLIQKMEIFKPGVQLKDIMQKIPEEKFIEFYIQA